MRRAIDDTARVGLAQRRPDSTNAPVVGHGAQLPGWSHLAANPQQDALFNDVMGYLARQLHAAAIEAYDLSDVHRLVDVGGGHGHLVSTIVRRYPGMSAVVFDQPPRRRRR